MSGSGEIVPIHVDHAARRQDYTDDHHLGQLLVRDIFFTFQGEGPFAGRRAVFVRLGGCNYGGKGVYSPGCPWCDTDFSPAKSTWMDHEEVYKEIIRAHPKTDKRILVVLTGGEPLLQDVMAFIVNGSRTYNLHFQIESNGTQIPRIPSTNCYLVVSPKVPEMLHITGGRYPQLQSIVLERADCLKFVVSHDPESPYFNIPEYADKFMASGKTVYVSPMAIYKHEPGNQIANIWNPSLYNQVACALNHAYAARMAMERGFVLSMQQHLFCNVK